MKKGNNCQISETARVHESVILGNNVTIHDDAVIEENVRIDDNAVIGKLPMKAANSAVTKEQELPSAKISAGCIVGTNTVIYRGAKIGGSCLIADQATVRENVTIGEKTIVGRGVAIENFCKIGKRCKLETNSYITAHSTLEDNVFVAPGVLTSNDAFIGRTKERFDKFKGIIARKAARIGVGAVILPGVELGDDCLVAAGSIVTKDVPAKKIVLGAPAKVFRDVPEEQLLENQ